MKINVFRDGKKLLCRLPGEEKDTVVGELALALLMFKPEQLKEKLGNELPELVPICDLSDKEEVDLKKLNEALKMLYL